MRSSRSGMRCGLVVALVGLVALAGSPAAGQGTATIIGQVTDQSGAVLPGVTVTATSAALQVPQMTATTNEVGEYRLAPLPIGVYEVAFELASFRPVQRQNVRLTVGFTAKIDVSMGLANVAETVTVAAAAPLVDVTAAPGSTLFTQEALAAIPTGRNGVISLLNLAPGVRSWLDVGGNLIGENPDVRAFGQSGQVWYTIDGVSTVHLDQGGGSGSFWDSSTVEEARVQSLGTDAEFQTRGVQMNGVVKSGGNQFHGSGYWAQNNKSWQNNNISPELAAIGITLGNAIKSQYDVSGDLGGRIIRNKLWFYGALHKRSLEQEVLNAFKADGSPATDLTSHRWRTGKVSFQASPSNRFIAFQQWGRKFERSKTSEVRSYDARSDRDVLTRPSKVEWQGVHGNTLIASFLYGDYLYDSVIGSNTAGLVGRTDVATRRVTGESGVAGDHQVSSMKQSTGAVTWYKPNWLAGNHEFKAGFDYSTNYKVLGSLGPAKNYYLFTRNGAPFEFLAFNAPSEPKVQANLLGSYVRDSWTVGRRVTLNLGLRYDRQDAFVPDQCRDASNPLPGGSVVFPTACFPSVQLNIWNSVAPRLHAAYDLSGNGKTVIKGGWGRYTHMRQLEPDALRVSNVAIRTAVYRWHDLNGNNDYDPGEVNLDLNGPDFVQTVGRLSQGRSLPGAPPSSVVNPDEKQPKYDELSVSLEHELISNFAVRATGLYSRTFNVLRIQNNLRPYGAYNIPITNRDPGPDGVLGTADDGGLLTYYEFSPALAGAQFEVFMPVNDPSVNESYKSFELAAVKRLANRWQFMASYAATKNNVPNCCAYNTSNIFGVLQSAHEVGNLDPNDEINRADHTWEWNGKAMGAYIFPADVQVSANFEHRSGDVFARQVLFTGGNTIPSILLNVEPLGSQRLPNLNLVTLRAEKTFAVYKTHKLAVRLNVYNALNASTATDEEPRAGEEFLRPAAILPPRIAELSASYTF